jgi:hypothetical protein
VIVLSFDLDRMGRPVVALFAAPTAARIAALEAVGELSPRPVEIRALVDTGASRSFVQASVLEQLELDSLGTDLIHTPTTGPSPKLARVYALQLFFPGVTGGQLAADSQVVELEDLSGFGVDMLLGRDVIGRCLLVFSGPENRVTMAFGSQ